MTNFKDPIEFCFGKQLKENKPLTNAVLSKLKGKSLYSEYKEGDVILCVCLQEMKKSSINISIKTLVKRDIDRFMKEFSFVRMSGDDKFPVFEKKSKVSK